MVHFPVLSSLCYASLFSGEGVGDLIVEVKRDQEIPPVLDGMSAPDGFYSMQLIRTLSNLIFFSAVSIPFLKCSYEGAAIILLEKKRI